jgi:hypothetical protein
MKTQHGMLRQFARLGLGGTVGMLIFEGLIPVAQAMPPAQGFRHLQPPAKVAQSTRSPRLRLPPGVPRSQRPNQTRAGGSLNESCQKTDPVLSALVPQQNPVFTVKGQPTIWVYVPYGKAEIERAEFSVNIGIDEKEQLYRTAIALPPAPGFMSLTLPASAELKPDIPYRWYLTLQCKGSASTVQLSVDGGIERRAAASSTSGEGATGYDTVAAAAEQLRLQPQDKGVRDRWQKLLTELGLADLANEPLPKP